MTHKFDVGGHEGYITVGLYDDGSPGEIFIRIAKEGSTIGGLMDTIATLVSVSLQYGVPVESLVRKFEHVRFEPSRPDAKPRNPLCQEPGRLHLPLARHGIRPRLQSRQRPQTRIRSPRRRGDRGQIRIPPKRRPKPPRRKKAATGMDPHRPGHGRDRSRTRDEEIQAAKTTGAGGAFDRDRILRLAIVVDPLSQAEFGIAGGCPGVRCVRQHHRPQRDLLQMPELREFDGVQLTAFIPSPHASASFRRMGQGEGQISPPVRQDPTTRTSHSYRTDFGILDLYDDPGDSTPKGRKTLQTF